MSHELPQEVAGFNLAHYGQVLAAEMTGVNVNPNVLADGAPLVGEITSNEEFAYAAGSLAVDHS